MKRGTWNILPSHPSQQAQFKIVEADKLEWEKSKVGCDGGAQAAFRRLTRCFVFERRLVSTR